MKHIDEIMYQYFMPTLSQLKDKLEPFKDTLVIADFAKDFIHKLMVLFGNINKKRN
jgi:hypothetical protein